MGLGGSEAEKVVVPDFRTARVLFLQVETGRPTNPLMMLQTGNREVCPTKQLPPTKVQAKRNIATCSKVLGVLLPKAFSVGQVH